MIDKKYLTASGRLKKEAPNSVRREYYLDYLSLPENIEVEFPTDLKSTSYIKISCKKHGFIKNITITNAKNHGGCYCSKCRMEQ